jgi:hypothetical protein
MDSIDTTQGNNWTVFVFDINPGRWKFILPKLINLFPDSLTCIPHFTVRAFSIPPGIFLRISYRVLREIQNENKIVDEIIHFAKVNNISKFRIDPQKGDEYSSYHAWIKKGKTSSKWTKERCEILHQMSKMVAIAAENDVFDTDSRAEWAHLAVNMFGVHEAVKNSNSYYFDVLSGEYRGYYKTIRL